MNRRLLISAASLTLAFSYTPRVRADEAADARKAVEAAYAKIDDALLHKDVRAQFSFLATTYTELGQYGAPLPRMTVKERETAIPKMEAAIKDVKVKSCKTTIKKFEYIQKKDGFAVVDVERHSEDQRPAPGSTTLATVVTDTKIHDLWKRQNGKWLIATHHNGGSRITVNGRPVH